MPNFWAVVAGTLAAGLEFAYRGRVDWLHNLWWIVPGAIGVNFGVYQLLRTDFGWLPSMVLFGAVTATCRIALAFLVIHEPVTAPNLAAALVMVAGVGIKLFWR